MCVFSLVGYEGERCHFEVNECLSNPCLNNGSCVDQIGGHLCKCPKNYFGSQCETKQKLLKSTSLSYHYIVWPSLSLLLLILILILSTIIFARIRENRRLQGTYQPALNENDPNARVEFSMILKPPPEERLI